MKLNPSLKILKSLIENGPQDWGQILKATNLCKGSVSNHLNKLIELNFIEVIIAIRPRRNVYHLIENFQCPVCNSQHSSRSETK